MSPSAATRGSTSKPSSASLDLARLSDPTLARHPSRPYRTLAAAQASGQRPEQTGKAVLASGPLRSGVRVALVAVLELVVHRFDDDLRRNSAIHRSLLRSWVTLTVRVSYSLFCSLGSPISTDSGRTLPGHWSDSSGASLVSCYHCSDSSGHTGMCRTGGMDKAMDGATSFGERLRALREAAGLTQEELAERAGLTADGIGALERGTRRRPYPHTLRALAEGLALTESERAAL